MNPIQPSQVNLFAVGIEKYKYMRSLHGPRKDIERFVDLMGQSSETGLYQSSQIKTLLNPDSATLKTIINEYVINRSAQGDVLIFYFSGHGIPIGHSDFGFCTSDARIHDVTGALLPLTVVRFRDLIDSLRVMSITPVIIIDACYSGMVGSAISSLDTIQAMQREITRQNASNYAFLCSCSEGQISVENNKGGVFSQLLFDVLSNGFKTQKSKKIIFIQDIISILKDRVFSEIVDSTPQLFLGETTPAIPLLRNGGFLEKRYRFSPYMAEIVTTLWNQGNEIELKKDEILSIIGRGAYGNHRKLSYSGWDLVEDNPVNGKRRLTERGRLFALGNLRIPHEVVYDPETNNYIGSVDTDLVDLNTALLGLKVKKNTQ